MKAISIALATRNGERFLWDQLRSFARQLRLPDELVVSDDASTDGTVGIVERFRDLAPFPVKLYQSARALGVARNFQQAVSACTGTLIFLSDQDDIWFPNKIEVVERLADRTKHLLYVNDLVNLFPDGEVGGSSFLQSMRAGRVDSAALVKGCATAIDSRLLRLALPFPPTLGHDQWLHELAEAFGSREVVTEVLQVYRVHEGQHSGWQPTVARRSERVRARLNRLARMRVTRSHLILADRMSVIREVYERITADGWRGGLDEDGLDIGRARADVWRELERLSIRRSYGATTSIWGRARLVGGEVLRTRGRVYRGVVEALRDIFFP